LAIVSVLTFESVFAQYADMVLRIARHGTRNLPVAEDITQEVFIKYAQCNKVFDSEDHLKAWLIRVTINHTKNHQKTFWAKRVVPVGDARAVGEEQSAQSRAVMEELFQLPYKDRVVIYLFYYEGYSLQEIAWLMGKSINTVSSQLQRARAKLKHILTREDDHADGLS